MNPTRQEQSASIARAFVCGWPVTHSRSPLIHGYWLKHLGLKGEYVRQPVEPGKLGDFLGNLRDLGFVGGNVTIPHKENALSIVDEPEEAAARIGAVNTLWFDGDKLMGGNTDWIGFAANLDQNAPGWDEAAKHGKTALVLGAGGAARAIVYALQNRGFQTIGLANRTMTKAEAIAADFGSDIVPLPLAETENFPADPLIVVNTTSLGMVGQHPVPQNLISYVGELPSDTLVTDIVYAPLITPLLEQASKRGMKTVDGLGMLLHQAVPGFEKWFGRKPIVSEELRALVLDDIAGHA